MIMYSCPEPGDLPESQLKNHKFAKKSQVSSQASKARCWVEHVKNLILEFKYAPSLRVRRMHKAYYILDSLYGNMKLSTVFEIIFFK